MDMMRIRNLGIIAHIDAGKTTVSERFLFYSGKEHRIGEVDEGTATMDWMKEEQERGITITSAATSFRWRDCLINLIDTPGHVDFTAEVERSLRVLDGAIGVFDGVEGVEAQSETVWRQADKYRIPRLAFINKMDRIGADFWRSVRSIERKLHPGALVLQIPAGQEKEFVGAIDLMLMKLIRHDGASLGSQYTFEEIPASETSRAVEARARLVERIAETSEELMGLWLEDPALIDEGRLRSALRSAVLAGRFVPVLLGAALRNKGIQRLLDAVCDYLPSPRDVPVAKGVDAKGGKQVEIACNPDGPVVGLVFKTASDAHGDLTYIRMYSGRLRSGDALFNPRRNKTERVGDLYRMHANEREALSEGKAGDIVAIVGLKHAVTGDTLCRKGDAVLLEGMEFPNTVLSVAIEPKASGDRDRLVEILGRLEKEDPTFRVHLNQETGELVMSGMGELHLEVVRNRLRDEFKLFVNVGAPRVSYRQAVASMAVGVGRFEQKMEKRGLFAEVRLRVEQAPEQAGVEVRYDASPQEIPRAFEQAVREGVRGAAEGGADLGFPIIQSRVIVEGGKFHPTESNEVAFQAAAQMAFSEAVATGGLVILEPLMALEVRVPVAYVGEVIGDLNVRRARIDETDMESQGATVIRGSVPLAEMMGYSTRLRSLTQGRGGFSMEPRNYQAVPPEVQDRLSFA